MGVTEIRLYFMQLIGHNSVNVTQIPDKLGTEIRFNEPFISEPNFSMNGA